MSKADDRRLRSQFPADLAAILSLYWMTIPLVLFGSWLVMSIFNAGRRGDMTVLWIAIGLGGLGVVLLFFARLPLYQKRRWLQIGPRGLDPKHRGLYRMAYGLIAVSIAMLSLLVVLLR